MKHEILQTDETVQTVPYIEGLDERDRHFSPHLDHPRQQVALVETKSSVKPKWKRDGFVVVRVLEGSKVGLLEGHRELVILSFREVHAEDRKKFRIRLAKNDAQTIQFMNTRN